MHLLLPNDGMFLAIYETVKKTVELGRGAVVHFDGKLMAAITGNEKVDRLAVKVTYRDIDQLIGNCLR